MDLKKFMEEKLWEKQLPLVREEPRILASVLAKENTLSPDEVTTRATQAFATAASRLLAAAKGIWLITGRTEDRKKAIRPILERHLETSIREITHATRSATRAEAWDHISEELEREIKINFNLIISEFDNQVDPLAQEQTRTPVATETTRGYNPRLSILFLSAEPSRTPSGQRPAEALNLDTEFREIQRAIEVGRYRDQIDLTPTLAATAQELLDALNRVRPQVVHFSGHGTPSDGIVLVDDNGNESRPGPNFLISVFTALATDIRLVVLNSCFSEDQADAIAASIPVTIGTPCEVPDRAAIAFSRAFYSAISNGLSIAQAFAQAEAILTSISALHRPRLITKPHTDPAAIKLTRGPDHDNFEPLFQALLASTRDFLTQRGKLRDFLNDVALTPIESIKPTIGSPMLSGNLDRFRNFRESVQSEIDRTTEYCDSLDRISRRWSQLLSDAAVAKLARLEESTDGFARELRKLGRTTFSFIDRLENDAKRQRTWTEDAILAVEALIATLVGLRDFLRTSDQSVRLYYNQLVELLPGASERQQLPVL